MALSGSNKSLALKLRRSGFSITYIEKKLGIGRSTLSGWFKAIELTPSQKQKHQRAKAEGLVKARTKAAEWHSQQKQQRMLDAKTQASWVLAKTEVTDQVLEIALAMLYMGEGDKTKQTAMASSEPEKLKFFAKSLERLYGVKPNQLNCDLHLRADQDSAEIVEYWSNELGVPAKNFRRPSFDLRTKGRKSYENYKGVCVVRCGNIAIQRKLKYLYSLLCEQVVTGP